MAKNAAEKKAPQPPAAWQCWWSRPIGRVIDFLIYRTRVHGKSAVPKKGPVIFAANHISYLDGPVMVGAAPRYMHVLVRNTMFTGFLGWVLRTSGQISVDRSGDRAALQTAQAVLKRGGCVGILPEGTRGVGEVSEMNSGVAWLALNSDAVVVPVAILGTRITGEHRDKIPKPGRRFYVSFGAPVKIERGSDAHGKRLSGRAAMETATERIRALLSDHVQETITRTGQDLPDTAGQGE